jgi:acyl-CoA thioester hydrolase
MYSKRLYASWSDMDFNGHMASAAYLNKCGDVRMMLFAENGFPVSELARLRIGPVTMRDELEYLKEVVLMQELLVTMELAGLSDDGSRWAIRHDFRNADGELCARVTSSGGWLDLTIRKLIVPPAGVLTVTKILSVTEDFSVSSSFIKGNSARP